MPGNPPISIPTSRRSAPPACRSPRRGPSGSWCTSGWGRWFEWDEASGRYWPSYHSANCPLPGADPEETAAWEEEQELAREADLAGVKGFADADGSGFVSTAEGQDFRSLVEYGYLAAQLLEEGKTSIQELAAASGLSEPAARSRLDAYLAVVERDKASGSTLFPEIPYAFSDGE